MITPEQKDALLIRLIETVQPIHINNIFFTDNFLEQMSIIRQFERRNFIKVIQELNPEYKIISIEADAHDFIQRGGYRFEEDVFRNNFTKLEQELAKLENDIPQQNFTNIMTFITAISAVMQTANSFTQ